MKTDFGSGRITMIIAPVDMRSGYNRLSIIAHALFDINVDEGKDFVVFVSRQRQIVKMIWRDETGSCMLTRKLNIGRFENFLVKEAQHTMNFTPDDLIRYLDGKRIFKRLK